MLLKTRGIVFRTVKYGETSVIADIFTEEHGLHTFIGGSVRTARARMPFGLFQPMTVVDLVSYFRDDAGALNRLKELRAAHVYRAIPFDLRRGAVALFMAEICRKCVQETESNPELFDFLFENLRWLDETPHALANLHLHFLLHLSAFLGFQPQLELEATGKELFFDLKEGVFLSVPPAHAQHLEVTETQQLLDLLDAPLEQCHRLVLSRSERKALLQQLLLFYQMHIPGFSDVHTPDVLEMVLE